MCYNTFYKGVVLLLSDDLFDMKFPKKDIVSVSLCETLCDNGLFHIDYIGDSVGFLNDNVFIDFIDGNFYSVIDIDSSAKSKPLGVYVTGPNRIYDGCGKISPSEVISDFNNSKVARRLK